MVIVSCLTPWREPTISALSGRAGWRDLRPVAIGPGQPRIAANSMEPPAWQHTVIVDQVGTCTCGGIGTSVAAHDINAYRRPLHQYSMYTWYPVRIAGYFDQTLGKDFSFLPTIARGSESASGYRCRTRILPSRRRTSRPTLCQTPIHKFLNHQQLHLCRNLNGGAMSLKRRILILSISLLIALCGCKPALPYPTPTPPLITTPTLMPAATSTPAPLFLAS